MNKTSKYALNGAGIGIISGFIFSLIKQYTEMNHNPNQKFDWGQMFKTGLIGGAIGGLTGLAVGAITDYQNKNEQPINTDPFLNDFVNNVKLDKKDKLYLILSKKADFLTNLLINKFSDKLANLPLRYGSTEKGTALKDKYDIDLFISFKPNSFRSTKVMSECLLIYFEEQIGINNIINVRDQKKSIGVIFEIKDEEYKIDIVPCKLSKTGKENTSGYLYLNDSSFYGKSSYTKTDFNALTRIKLNETQKKIIILLKHWKNENDLSISSYLIENYVVQSYSASKFNIPKTFAKKVIMVLEHIKNNIDSEILVSIENTNNVLNNMPQADKIEIINACKKVIENYEYQPNSVIENFGS
jgi:hypothetical protein